MLPPPYRILPTEVDERAALRVTFPACSSPAPRQSSIIQASPHAPSPAWVAMIGVPAAVMISTSAP